MGLLTGIKKKIIESNVERRREGAIRKAQQKEARDVYLEEKGKQEIEFARARAKAESKQRITAMQQSFKKPRGNGNMMAGLGGASSGVVNFLGMGNLPGFPQQQPKRKVKPQKTRYKIIGGKAYPVAGSSRKGKRTTKKAAQPNVYNWF